MPHLSPIVTHLAGGISQFRGYLRAGQRGMPGYLELRPAVGIHGHDLLRPRQDVPGSMRRGAASRQPILVDGSERSHVANTGIRRRVGGAGQLTRAPGHVLAGKRYWRRRRAELAGRRKLDWPILSGDHRRLESYALEMTAAAAATQSRAVEKQEGPDRMETKSAHDPPPHEFSMGLG